jgi:hypothetical protein
MLFCDASFAGDLKDSKSTSGSLLCLVGPNTFCPISWLCKKQGAVSHSSTEAEIIALDMGFRLEGIPTWGLWEIILNVMDPDPNWIVPSQVDGKVVSSKGLAAYIQELLNVDFVSSNIPISNGRGKLVILEDNDACIKMCLKARSISMRHVPRVHRVDVDWLLEKILTDTGINIKYINTKAQIADIFTKGSFTEITWKVLCRLFQVGMPGFWESKSNFKSSQKFTHAQPPAEAGKGNCSS